MLLNYKINIVLLLKKLKVINITLLVCFIILLIYLI